MLAPQQTLNCNGQLLLLDQPIVMGILNITPDSFYDGGKYKNLQQIVDQAGQQLEEGAAILDIGGMSSRPGAELISIEEELNRVLPVIEILHQSFPNAILSIDTIHAKVAQAAVEAGASIINDISAGKADDTLYSTVAQLNVPYILMHMQGMPNSMQKNPHYEDILVEIVDFFIAEIGKLRALGIKDIIIDPGFGFGKTIRHNYQILQHLHAFNILDVPIMVGISRKSMIYKLLNSTPQNALNGTTALHMIALQEGARILRVHDVKEATEVIQLWQELEQAKNTYLCH